MNGYDLPGAQGLSEPEQEQPEEDEEHGAGFGRFLGQTFGQGSTFQLRSPPLQQAQFTPTGSGLGGSAPRAGSVTTPPGESAAALSHNAFAANAVSQLHGSRLSNNGRSAADVGRAQFGTPQVQ